MKILSHEKLGLTFQHLGALLGTLSLLENEVLKYSKNWDVHPKKHLFNMDVWSTQAGCGTVSCVGGTMGIIVGTPHGALFDPSPEALEPLFFPNHWARDKEIEEFEDYSHITARATVRTIRHFLATGKVDWTHVLNTTQKRQLRAKAATRR